VGASFVGVRFTMTIQIKGVQIAGLPAITVRNVLRRADFVFDENFVAERCKVSVRKAKEVLAELLSDGYIECSEGSRRLISHKVGKKGPRHWCVDYKLTAKGVRLAQASAVSRMPRMRADRIVADFMERVQEVNANPEYMYRIPTVVVYGSYVRGEPTLGDVDVAVDLEAKCDSAHAREWSEKRVQAALARGRSFSSFEDILGWPEAEVMLHLKARTRGLSLQRLNHFVAMEKDKLFVYEVLFGDAARLAEQITRKKSSR